MVCCTGDIFHYINNFVGVKWIEKAWEGFCEVMKIDKYGKYDSWDEILEFLGE